jgi:hypothetical protein
VRLRSCLCSEDATNLASQSEDPRSNISRQNGYPNIIFVRLHVFTAMVWKWLYCGMLRCVIWWWGSNRIWNVVTFYQTTQRNITDLHTYKELSRTKCFKIINRLIKLIYIAILNLMALLAFKMRNVILKHFTPLTHCGPISLNVAKYQYIIR